MRPANKGKESEKNIWGGGFLGGSVWWLTCNLGDPGLIRAGHDLATKQQEICTRKPTWQGK